MFETNLKDYACFGATGRLLAFCTVRCPVLVIPPRLGLLSSEKTWQIIVQDYNRSLITYSTSPELYGRVLVLDTNDFPVVSLKKSCKLFFLFIQETSKGFNSLRGASSSTQGSSLRQIQEPMKALKERHLQPALVEYRYPSRKNTRTSSVVYPYKFVLL